MQINKEAHPHIAPKVLSAHLIVPQRSEPLPSYLMLRGRKTERAGGWRKSDFLSPRVSVIDLLLFKYLSSSFIYAQLYLFRLTSTLSRSQPVTYALLTRMLSTSCGSHLLLLLLIFFLSPPSPLLPSNPLLLSFLPSSTHHSFPF